MWQYCYTRVSGDHAPYSYERVCAHALAYQWRHGQSENINPKRNKIHFSTSALLEYTHVFMVVYYLRILLITTCCQRNMLTKRYFGISRSVQLS